MNLDLGYTKLIIEKAKARGVLRNQLAYILATAYHETAHTMKPVKEAFWLSEDWRKKNLRYYPWYGRGFVQLTWDYNYKKASQKLGVDFMKNPEGVMDPKNSAEILVVGSMEGWFTGKKIPDYITLQRSDYVNARRVINGTDRASEIAKLAQVYEADLKKIGYGVTVFTDTGTWTKPSNLPPVTIPVGDGQTLPKAQENSPKTLLDVFLWIYNKVFNK